jgi:fructokinase
MNKQQIKVMIALAAIAMANKEGFTVDAANLQPVTSGYAVAVADTQNSFGFEGLANVVKYVSAHPEINAFGGWYNSENNMYYFDAIVIVNDLEAAKELGRVNKQIAIFDLANLKEIRL